MFLAKLSNKLQQLEKQRLAFWPTIILMITVYLMLMGVASEVSTNPADGTENAGPIDLWMHFFDANEVYNFLHILTASQMQALQRGWFIDTFFAFPVYIPGLGMLWSYGCGALLPKLEKWNIWPVFVAILDTVENVIIGIILYSLSTDSTEHTLLANVIGIITPVKEIAGNLLMVVTIFGAIWQWIRSMRPQRSYRI